MLAENWAMFHLICTLRLPYTATTRHGEMQVLVSLPSIMEQITLERSTHKLAA
jgi:hypothetical protein